MKISRLRFITAWLLLSCALLAIVPLYDYGRAFFSAAAQISVVYSGREILFAITGESLRAFLLCYLYPQLRDAGSSLEHATGFGLLTTALVGSVWLFIGYGSFNLRNPESFLINDSILLILQGLLTGPALYYAYKQPQQGISAADAQV